MSQRPPEGQPNGSAALRRATLEAYDDYVRRAGAEAVDSDIFVAWADRCGKRTKQHGEDATIVACAPDVPSIPDGMIHDWAGRVRVRGTTVEKTLALVQDYDNHKRVYTPQVADSKLLRRDGDDFQIYLRMLKKKIVTVVLDTWHSVEYGRVSDARAFCRSHTTRVCEIDHPQTPKELTRLPDTGHGFLWRMYSHWDFEETGDEVCIDCRVISLTRDIPPGLAWIIGPMVQKLPAESLKSTLEATKRALSVR